MSQRARPVVITLGAVREALESEAADRAKAETQNFNAADTNFILGWFLLSVVWTGLTIKTRIWPFWQDFLFGICVVVLLLVVGMGGVGVRGARDDRGMVGVWLWAAGIGWLLWWLVLEPPWVAGAGALATVAYGLAQWLKSAIRSRGKEEVQNKDVLLRTGLWGVPEPVLESISQLPPSLDPADIALLDEALEDFCHFSAAFGTTPAEEHTEAVGGLQWEAAATLQEIVRCVGRVGQLKDIARQRGDDPEAQAAVAAASQRIRAMGAGLNAAATAAIRFAAGTEFGRHRELQEMAEHLALYASAREEVAAMEGKMPA